MALDEFVKDVLLYKDAYGIDVRPFYATEEMIEEVYEIQKREGVHSARAVYDWMHKNIEVEELYAEGREYKSAEQTYEQRKGVCVDTSFLYVAMTRILGLESNITNVFEDVDGTKMDHMCSWVNMGGLRILVDTQRGHGFNIKFKRFKMYETDREACDFYNKVVLPFNEGNVEEYRRNAKRIDAHDLAHSVTEIERTTRDNNLPQVIDLSQCPPYVRPKNSGLKYFLIGMALGGLAFGGAVAVKESGLLNSFGNVLKQQNVISNLVHNKTYKKIIRQQKVIKNVSKPDSRIEEYRMREKANAEELLKKFYESQK